MKKMFFLLSVAFLLVAATPAWPANNNGPMSEQKWPETVQAWPDADDMVSCDFSFPICAWPSTGEAWPVTGKSMTKACNYPVSAWPSETQAWPSPSGYPFPANIGYPLLYLK